MMVRPPARWTRCLAAAALPLALLAFAAVTPRSAHAQILVDSSVVSGEGVFTYSFSVTNNTALTLAVVSLEIPTNTPLTNLMAPTGFFIDYDPDPALDGSVPGVVDFLEDADPATPQTFAPGITVAGFGFQSTTLFTPSAITALDIEGNAFNAQGNAVAVPGTTTLSTVAPEPGTLGLVGIAGFGTLTAWSRRRRRATPAAAA